jgi:hypothetical protein
MFKRTIAAVVILVAFTASAWAASPVGLYQVSGTNPGTGTRYSGTVMVRATGQFTFRVVWTIAGQSVTGTGLWVDEKFCVGYAGNSIAVYTDQGGNVWSGHWANGNATQVGTERWSR